MAFSTDMFAGMTSINSASAVAAVLPPHSGWAGITREPNAGGPSSFQAGTPASYAITVDKFAVPTYVALPFAH